MERGTAGAIIVASGIALAGIFVGLGVSQVRASDRFVTVKGVSEREVRADVAIWPLHVIGADNDLAAAQGKMNRSLAGVKQFLARHSPDKAPDALLLNGGVFNAPPIVDALVDAIGAPEVLPSA